MSIIVNLTLATICFTYAGTEECHPVLLGRTPPTPSGEYTLTRRYTSDPGYGGDVLQFKEDKYMIYALHRVWLLRPEQRRMERFGSKNIQDRFISSGCINVEPEVYEKLISCCISERLIIR
jgi:hypothetical protein